VSCGFLIQRGGLARQPAPGWAAVPPPRRRPGGDERHQRQGDGHHRGTPIWRLPAALAAWRRPVWLVPAVAGSHIGSQWAPSIVTTWRHLACWAGRVSRLPCGV